MELAKEPPDIDIASGAYVLPRTVQFIHSATAAGSKVLSNRTSSHLARHCWQFRPGLGKRRGGRNFRLSYLVYLEMIGEMSLVILRE